MGFFTILAAFFVFSAVMTIEPIRDFLFGDLDDLGEDNPGRGITVTKRGSLENIPVIYGFRRVGGIVNFKGVEGSNNEYLWYEFILSEGKCQHIWNVYLDGVDSNDSKFDGLVTVTKYLGEDGVAADVNLVSKFSDYNNNDRCRGLCRVVVSLKYDQERMPREPKFEFLVAGISLYDVRTETFQTGLYPNVNPAIALYDYLTNSRYGAGYKISASQLVTQDFIDAANYCETQIELYSGAGSNTDYYQINGVIDTGKSVRKNIIEILNSFNAHLIPDGNQYRLIVEKDEASVLSLDSDNIIDSSVTYAINDVKERYNEIVVDYPNEENNYLDDQFIEQDATLLAADNSIESQKRIKNYLDVNQYRMGHFGRIVLKKSRQGIAVGLTVNESGFEVLPGAIVDVTLTEPGWSAKKFRVLKVKELEGGNIAMNLLEHEATVYDRTVPVAAPTPPDTYLPDPFSVAQVSGLSAASGITHVIVNSAGDLVARILLSWTTLADVFITNYEIRSRINGETDWIYQTPAIGGSTNSQYIIGFKDSDLVDLEVRAVNSRGVVGAWSSTLQHSVEGALADPPDVDYFDISLNGDGTRVATFRLNTPPVDLAGYKIRYSSDQSATWPNMEELHEGLLTQSPFEFNLLSEGTYRFAIKAFDRGGRESVNANFLITELAARRIGSILRTDNPRGQGWPGTLIDCRIEPSDNSLVADTTTTWADLTDTWDDYTSWFFDTGTTFSYVFVPSGESAIDLGAQLRVALDVAGNFSEKSEVVIEESHSDDDITYTSYAPITGFILTRYIRIKVTVTNTINVPKINNLNIYIGGDSIVDFFTELDTSTLTTVGGQGVRLPIRSSFSAITDVNISLKNVGSGYTWEFIDLNPTLGPHIKIWDGGGVIDNSVVISAQVIGV